MMKKSIAIIMMLMLVFLMAGCGAKSDTPESTQTPAVESNDSQSGTEATTEEATPEKLVLKIGLDDAYPPFEYHEEATNNLIGFDIDFSQALAEEIGAEIEYVPTAWDGIFNGVNTGQFDMIISCVSITPDRQEGFNMSSPYLANGIVIVSPTDGAPAASVADLDGKTIGVQLETTADVAAQKFIADGADLDVLKYDTIMEAFAALKGGSIDYILVDSSVGGFYISTDPESYEITSDLLSNEPIGVCISKDNTELLEKVNAGIKALQDSGKMTELSQKWFSADFATNIDTEIQVIE